MTPDMMNILYLVLMAVAGWIAAKYHTGAPANPIPVSPPSPTDSPLAALAHKLLDKGSDPLDAFLHRLLDKKYPEPVPVEPAAVAPVAPKP